MLSNSDEVAFAAARIIRRRLMLNRMMTIASADTPAPTRERRTTPAIGMIFSSPGAADALVARNTQIGTRVRSATVPDSRSEEEAMLIHCDRRATTKTGPFRPKAGTNLGVTCH